MPYTEIKHVQIKTKIVLIWKNNGKTGKITCRNVCARNILHGYAFSLNIFSARLRGISGAPSQEIY